MQETENLVPGGGGLPRVHPTPCGVSGFTQPDAHLVTVKLLESASMSGPSPVAGQTSDPMMTHRNWGVGEVRW